MTSNGGSMLTPEGIFTDCPAAPHCVSSLAAPGTSHYIQPLRFQTDASIAYRHLLDVINSFPRTRIINDDGHFIHATFSTAVFRFVDDVVFLLDKEHNKIEVKSVSRVGYYDFGTNRRRVEQLRVAFNKRQAG